MALFPLRDRGKGAEQHKHFSSQGKKWGCSSPGVLLVSDIIVIHTIYCDLNPCCMRMPRGRGSFWK